MNLPRCAGILMHASSLPTRFGIGDFGPAAIRFVDQLSAAGQTLWQVLPLGPVGAGNSPYQSYSAFAGEPLFISPELLLEDRVLSRADLIDAPDFPARAVDYDEVRKWKLPLLRKAHQNFTQSASSALRHAYEQFCADQGWWLDDYALFVALKDRFGSDRSWNEWDKDLARRNPGAIAKASRELSGELNCCKYLQFAFYRQWDALRDYCSARGVKIMGDIPIYVSQESSDVWAHPRQFLLRPNGKPKAVSGVPPDYFSETGQLWGNPIYNWKEMEQTGFHWWLDRFRGTFRLYDLVRMDHFRGFEAYWEVPADEETARNGRWINAPGEKLFEIVFAELGQLQIVAENLGVITPEVEALRRKFNFPGMAILQFAFGIEGNAATYRPHSLEHEVVAYTGTHDNDTVMGWWKGEGGDTRSEEDIQKERAFALRYLGPSEEPINWRLIRAYWGSVARVVITPMQDVLALGSEARMNRPGTSQGNWAWRMETGEFTQDRQEKLLDLTTLYDRAAKPKH